MDVLGQSKHPKLYFLRLYAKYLVDTIRRNSAIERLYSNFFKLLFYQAGEKRKEEFSQDVLGATEQTRADNAELESIYRELHEDYEHGRLDAFGLYLYGIVLKKRQLAFRAAAILLESIRKYQYNWSAWVELATLVQTKKMFMDLRALLNREFETSVMKEFFLAKLCIDLNQPGNFFKDIMDPLDQYFSRSAYVLSQWATFYYDSMGKANE